MNGIARLQPLHLDALRELANIGSGHAATALSHMIGRPVRVSVPALSITPRTAVSDAVGAADEPTVMLRLGAGGSFASGIVLVFTERDAGMLADLLLGDLASPPFGPLARSALAEAGNVLAAAYLNALAGVTGWTIPLSAPELLRLRAGGADVALAWAADYVLCLETTLTAGDGRAIVRGHVLLFPRRGAITDVLAALNLAPGD